jgi:hypothetical protein
MDPLALLCNLHADGAASLERLQRADCRDLGAIEALRELELAALLGEGPAFARRFQREAALLRSRLGVDLLEAVEEDDAPRAHALSTPADPALPASPPAPRARTPRATAASHTNAPEAKAGPKSSASHKGSELGRRELYAGKPLMGAVLDAWRARDLVDPPLTAQAPARAATGLAASDALAPGQLEGLGRAELEQLARAGCTSRSALLAAEAAVLARASGLALTRVLRWQFLARRALAPVAQGAPSASAASTADSGASSLPSVASASNATHEQVASANGGAAPNAPASTDTGALDAAGPFA